MDGIDHLLDRDQNRDAFGRVLDLLKKGAITPFVGAGLSRPCGLPLWGEFLLELAKDSGLVQEVQSWIDSGDILEAADRLRDTLGARVIHHRITARFGRVACGEAPLRGALSHLSTLTRDGPVITTNFDQLLERTFQNAGHRFERADWGWRPVSMRQALVERRH